MIPRNSRQKPKLILIDFTVIHINQKFENDRLVRSILAILKSRKQNGTANFIL